MKKILCILVLGFILVLTACSSSHTSKYKYYNPDTKEVVEMEYAYYNKKNNAITLLGKDGKIYHLDNEKEVTTSYYLWERKSDELITINGAPYYQTADKKYLISFGLGTILELVEE